MKKLWVIPPGIPLQEKYLRMTFNVLIGYIAVEIFAAIAHALGLSSITYLEILLLALVANGGTVLFMLYIRHKTVFTEKTEALLFSLELGLYLLMLSIAVYKLQEIRTAGLVFALIAVTILLPYLSFLESLAISISSLVVFAVVSACAILVGGQSGSLALELFYCALFVPVTLLVAFTAKQLQDRTREVEVERQALERLNDDLIEKNVQLERASERNRIEMDLAGQVQKSFFPAEPPDSDLWDIAFRFKPVHEVSGDLYDFYLKNGEIHGVSLFDVSGHGLSSGLITMIVRPILYRLFNRMAGRGLAAVAQEATDMIHEEIEGTETFVTGILLRFDENGVEYVNVGHPDIMLRRGDTSEVRVVSPKESQFRGLPIGTGDPAVAPRAIRFVMKPGDSLLLYTDGLFDGLGNGTAGPGMDRIREVFSRADGESARELCDTVIEKYEKAVGEFGATDDVTVIVIRRR